MPRMQVIHQLSQGDVWCRLDQRQDLLGMDLDLARALIAALPPGPDIARAVPPIDPFDRSRGRYAKVLCRRATGQPAINRRYKPITKVIGKGSCHAGWPPSPAHTLNQKFELVGIPYDSIRSENALG